MPYGDQLPRRNLPNRTGFRIHLCQRSRWRGLADSAVPSANFNGLVGSVVTAQEYLPLQHSTEPRQEPEIAMARIALGTTLGGPGHDRRSPIGLGIVALMIGAFD